MISIQMTLEGPLRTSTHYLGQSRVNYSVDSPFVIAVAHICAQSLDVFGEDSFHVAITEKCESILVPPPRILDERVTKEMVSTL